MLTNLKFQDNWHWACGNGGGEKYTLCFEVSGTYMDPFGDKIDPNNPKCPEWDDCIEVNHVLIHDLVEQNTTDV